MQVQHLHHRLLSEEPRQLIANEEANKLGFTREQMRVNTSSSSVRSLTMKKLTTPKPAPTLPLAP
jgi:hypothetical protein